MSLPVRRPAGPSRLLLPFLFLFLLPAHGLANSPVWGGLTWAGGLPYGPCYSLAAQGDTLYVGNGSTLQIYRVTDGGDCDRLGETLLFDRPRHLAVDGDWAYVALENGGLRIVDVSDPAAPRTISHLYTVGSGGGLALRGGCLYFLDAEHVLHTYDVRDPAAPIETSRLDTQLWIDLAIVEPYLYLLWDDPDCNDVFYARAFATVFDLSEAGVPEELGWHVMVDAIPHEIAASDRWSCVSFRRSSVGGPRSIAVQDCSDPLHPEFICEYYTGGTVYEMLAAGDTLHVTLDGGLHLVLDMKDPATIAELDRVERPAGGTSLATAGGLTFFGGGSMPAHSGSVGCLVPDPDGGLEVRSLMRWPGSARDVRRIDEHRLHDEYTIMEISDAMEVTLLADCIPGRDFVIDGQLAYVAEYRGLIVLDISDLTAPEQIGAWWTAMNLRTIAYWGDHVAVTNAYDDFMVVDIGDPGHPGLVGQCHLPGPGGRIVIDGDRAHVLIHSGGLVTIDIGQPETPRVLSHVAPDMPFGWQWISGSHLYMAGPDGFAVLDLAAPGGPAICSTLDLPSHKVCVLGRRAYVSTGDALEVLDVSDPTVPRIVGRFDPAPQIEGLTCLDGRIVLGMGGAGLWILEDGAAVPTALARFTVERQEGRVLLRGELSALRSGSVLAIHREAGDGRRVPVAEVSLAGGLAFEAEDPGPPAGAAVYRLQEVRPDGGSEWLGEARLAAAGPPEPGIGLVRTYPNPFNPRLGLELSLDRARRMRLTVHDLAGRRLAVLAEGDLPAGRHELTWDGRDRSGRAMAGGVYVLRLSWEGGVQTRKVVLVR